MSETIRDAAVRMLVSYGYDRLQAEEAVRRALKNIPNPLSVEDLLKRSLDHV